MKNIFFSKNKTKKEKISSLLLNIRTTQFDQRSPVQPNPEKKTIGKVLPIEKISLQPELSSPSHFRFQGGYPERYTQKTDGGRTNKNPCV